MVLVGLAVLAYFGVRGLTEGDAEAAQEHAEQILRLEQAIGIDFEHGLQTILSDHQWLVTLTNWVYIWSHWPVIAATLIYLAARHRDHYIELRNALFISGAMGLVIFATYAASPPRLYGGLYIDTVTQNSVSYRLLQPGTLDLSGGAIPFVMELAGRMFTLGVQFSAPILAVLLLSPALVNKYAAIPSFHFGWNLLVGVFWYRIGWLTHRWTIAKVAAFVMPLAMAFAVVATANHWTLDVVAGGVAALAGWAIERKRPHDLDRWFRRKLAAGPLAGFATEQSGRLTPDLHEPLDGGDGGEREHQPQDGLEERRDGEADGERDDPLRPLHEASFCLKTE